MTQSIDGKTLENSDQNRDSKNEKQILLEGNFYKKKGEQPYVVWTTKRN